MKSGIDISPSTTPPSTSSNSGLLDNTTQRSVILLAVVVVGPGIITFVAMFWCGRKSPAFDRSAERDINGANEEEGNFNGQPGEMLKKTKIY